MGKGRKARLLVLIAPIDGTPLLPTAEFEIGCCSSAFTWDERYRWVHAPAIRQMSYFAKPLTPFHEGPLLDHKAKSRKQQQAQDNSLEGCLIDSSEQDDTYS